MSVIQVQKTGWPPENRHTVNRILNMKREDQQDATIRCLLLTSVSTCFGHHYVHLQENKGPVTAFGVFWFCWMCLVAVVGRCVVGCEHCEGFCSVIQKPSHQGLCSPEDGHNDVRNML